MKPANFPERIRQRRLKALVHLLAHPKPVRSGYETDAEYQARHAHYRAKRESDIARLQELTAAPKRDVRTKKDRSARGRFHMRAA